jgi:hypothetical protein
MPTAAIMRPPRQGDSLDIPCKVIPNDSQKEPIECGVCYETVPSENQVSYDCGHIYCDDCAVKVYINHHKSCAICRKSINKLIFQSRRQVEITNEKIQNIIV